MAVSYKKLWHILVDRNMKKKDLEKAAGITHYQMYKLANNKDITTNVIGAICAALEVEPNDIMEFASSDYPPINLSKLLFGYFITAIRAFPITLTNKKVTIIIVTVEVHRTATVRAIGISQVIPWGIHHVL